MTLLNNSSVRRFQVICAILLFCTFFSCGKELVQYPLTIKKSDGTNVVCSVELALTPMERSRGFMERKVIPDGTGMLFAFPVDQRLSFWMKNTPTPLSIAYVDSSGIIRDIFDMKPFSTRTIQSHTSVRYALEVPQGWFLCMDIKPGDTLIFSDEMLRLIKTVRD